MAPHLFPSCEVTVPLLGRLARVVKHLSYTTIVLPGKSLQVLDLDNFPPWFNLFYCILPDLLQPFLLRLPASLVPAATVTMFKHFPKCGLDAPRLPRLARSTTRFFTSASAWSVYMPKPDVSGNHSTYMQPIRVQNPDTVTEHARSACGRVDMTLKKGVAGLSKPVSNEEQNTPAACTIKGDHCAKCSDTGAGSGESQAIATVWPHLWLCLPSPIILRTILTYNAGEGASNCHPTEQGG